MQSRRIFLLVGAVFMLCLSAMLVMMNTHTAPKLLVHKQDNAKHNDIAAAAISPQKSHKSSLFRTQDSKHQIHQRNAQKHDVAGNEIEENEFEENEVEENEFEEEEERGANPGFQKQLEMMLRDPKSGVIPDGIGYREREFVKTLPSRNGTVGRQFREKGTSELQASNLTWQARGPSNIGGRTRTVAIDVSNENVIIAGGVGGGGIWRSTNKGQSWVRMTSIPQAPMVTSIVQDKRPGKQNIWYCATGERISSGWPSRQQGILKSVDGGLTWQSLLATVNKNDFSIILNIALNPANTQQDEIIAATSEGLFRSTDGGTTWNMVLTVNGLYSSQKLLGTHISISQNGVYYAAMGGLPWSKVFRSTNGTAWNDITPSALQIPTTQLLRGLTAIAPSNPNIIYVTFARVGAGSGSSFFKYTYLSGDGAGAGGIWEDRSDNLISHPELKQGTQNGYCMLLDVHPKNENIVFWGGMYLARSMDGFQTSTQIQSILIHPDHHQMAFFSDGRMVAANDGGLNISITSGHLPGTLQWQEINSGYVNSQFYHVSIDENTLGSQIVMGGMQDNGTSLATQSGMSSWQNTGGGDGCASAIAAFGQDKLIYSSFQNGTILSRRLLKPTGQLVNYGPFAYLHPINATGQLFINPFILDPNNDSIMYYPAGKDLWRHNNLYTIPGNYDRIQGWQQFQSPGQSVIATLAAAKGTTKRLYIGTTGGEIFRTENPHIDTPVFVNISANKGLPAFAYCSSLAIDPTNPDRVIAVFSSYMIRSIFYTTNGGNTWEQVGGNLEENPDGSGNGPACISAAIVHYQGQTTYFVGTSAGLYSATTLNGMNTVWTLEDGVPPGVAVMHIAKRDADGFVAVGTHGAGVYSTFLGGIPPVSTVSLTGVVRANSSPLQPLQGVTITLSNGAQTTSDAAGAYSFANLPKGVYSVSVNYPNGYYATTKTVLKDLS